MAKLAGILALAITVVAGTANATTIVLDGTAYLPVILTPPPPSTGTPGQAVSMIEIGVGPTAGSYTSVVDCTLLLAGCTQSTGVASVPSDVVPYVNSVVADTQAEVGSDAALLITHASCPGTCSGTAFVNAAALDLQQLMITDGTGTLGTFVDIDVMFSLGAQFINNSTLPADQLVFGAGAQLWIGDPSTYSAPPSSYPRLSAPFEAFATATAVSPVDGVTDAVQTVALEMNRPYWVGLAAGTSLGVIGTNYTGLDVSMTASADPSFALNASWAASNPDLAHQITIQRTLNTPAAVPEPSSAALFGAGLALLLFGGVFTRPGAVRAARRTPS